MEERDTRLGKVEYILLHLAVGFLLYRFFTAEQYRLAQILELWKEYGPENRARMLHRMLWIFSGGGLVLTMGRLRYLPAAVLDLLMPYGAYLLCMGLKPGWLRIPAVFLLTFILFWTSYELIVAMGHSLGTLEMADVTLRRCGGLLQRAHLLAGTVMSVLLVGIAGWSVLSGGPAADPMELPAESISYMQELGDFGDRTWEELDRKERLELLRQVVKVETEYLGLTEPPVLMEQELDKHEGGHYAANEHTIVINSRILTSDDMPRCFTVILHECYHVFQRELCELGLPEGRNAFLRLVGEYDHGFRNYVSAETNYESYRNQRIEADARAYSEQRASAYSSILAELN